MTEPTDVEIESAWTEATGSSILPYPDDMLAFARAVLAKWGAPQQEAQEPVAWYVTGCGRLLDEDEAKAEARRIGGTARAMPLYTAPQADSVLEDAARYRFLARHCRSTSEHWGGRWSIVVDGPAPKSHDSEDDFDAAIDSARKKGANHD